MKSVVLAVFSLVGSSCATSSAPPELFVSRCEIALTKHVITLRVAETNRGLLVEESAPRRKSRVVLTGAAADAIRTRIARLSLTQSDIDFMASHAVATLGANGEEMLVLAPFDGARYSIVFRNASGLRKISVSNPEADVHFQAPPEQAGRLQEVMQLVASLTRLARGEEPAN